MDVYMNMHLWNCHLGKEHFPVVERLKEQGYDGIEFFFGSPSRADYKALGDFCKSIDMKVVNVCGAGEISAISPDPEVRKQADRWFKERIDDAVACGSTNIGGPFHAAVGYFPGHPPTQENFDHVVSFLQSVGDYAEGCGIRLTPEFLNRYEAFFATTMAEAALVLSAVDRKNVSAMFDTYHANIEEKSQSQAIRDIAPHLTHVHISENDRGTPGRGQIDFDPVFAELKRVGFDGTIAIEAFGTNDPGFANAVKVWRDFSPQEEIVSEGIDLVRSGIAKHGLGLHTVGC
jgi:D-psicose/D-tagatose/L-ribulose 3-epimerase